MTFKPNRLAVKFFTTEGTTVDLAQTVTVFQWWIQSHTVEGLLIDVTDYKHVPNGPGVILIGHEGDYSLDQKSGQTGLLYTLKRDETTSDFASQLTVSLRRALEAVRRLGKDRTLKKPQFETTQFELRILDRLQAPNTSEGLALVQNAVEEVLHTLGLELAGLEATSLTNARDVLTLKVSLAVDLTTVAEKFAPTSVPA